MNVGDLLIFRTFAEKFPHLKESLASARVQKKPAQYIGEVTITSFIMGISTTVLAIILFSIIGIIVWPSVFFGFITFFLFFSLFIHKPRTDFIKAGYRIESEIASAVRFIIMELRTDSSVYAALKETAENFPVTGIYLDEVIDKVKMGRTLEGSLLEAIEVCPSENMRNVFWQLVNGLQTGSNVALSLQTLLEDIIDGQKIRIEEYGRELNAISLFYMMFSIIIPSIGFTILSAFFTLGGISIGLGALLFVWGVLTFIQYFFMYSAYRRRPAVEAY